jgi:hypothetical protein
MRRFAIFVKLFFASTQYSALFPLSRQRIRYSNFVGAEAEAYYSKGMQASATLF